MKAPPLEEIFKESKVLTLDQVSKMRGCSVRTVQRQFAGLAVFRSYNKNSRYYTLAGIPKFNTEGIWGYRGILFSRVGDLRKTVQHLIVGSDCGLSGNEIGDIVGLQPRSFMQHFREMDGIFREKYGGVYVYFSDDPAVFARQSRKRNQICEMQKISDAVAVKLLIVYIKYPELSAEELSVALARENRCHVSATVIVNFLLFHDLLKKTPDFRP
jgi:AraC-like DNA-binding protein